jgi:hypothetical protein
MAVDKHVRAEMEEGETARKCMFWGPVLLCEVMV